LEEVNDKKQNSDSDSDKADKVKELEEKMWKWKRIGRKKKIQKNKLENTSKRDKTIIFVKIEWPGKTYAIQYNS